MTNYGTFIWNELVTEEPEKCGPFHSWVSGWERTDTDAAAKFLTTAVTAHGEPVEVTTDKAQALAKAIRELM